MRREFPAASGVASKLDRLLTYAVLGLVLTLAVLWSWRPLIHDDLFWHLATGRHVVEEGSVPTTDSFSFTRRGERWISHEWGFGLLVYGLHSATGYRGLIALKAAATVAILVLLLALSVRAAESSLTPPGPPLVALLALGLWAIDDQLILRPSLLSSLLLLVLLHLMRWFDRVGGAVPIAAIAVLFLVWGNLHGEVLFGLFVVALATLECLLGRRGRATDRPTPGVLQADPRRPYLTLLLVAVGLSLVNPNGLEVLLYPFRLARFLVLGEVPLEMGHFTGATPTAMPVFYLLLALLLWGLIPLRRAPALSLTEIVTLTVFLLLALRSHRFIFYFVLFALPAIAKLHGQRRGAPPVFLRSSGVRWATLGLTAVAVLAASASAWAGHPQRGVSRHFPAGTVRFIEQQGVEGRLFNHQNYGGYLHWNLDTPIFWDGRNLLFAGLMEEIRTLPLAEVAGRWRIDYLVVTELEFAQLRDQLDPERWALVLWDDFSALYLARRPRFEEIVTRYELRQLPPFGAVEGLNLLARDRERSGAARRELVQVLRFEPRCQRALYLLGLISFYSGDLEQAEQKLLAALAVEPNGYVYGALARVLDGLGRPEEARRMRLRAIDSGLE